MRIGLFAVVGLLTISLLAPPATARPSDPATGPRSQKPLPGPNPGARIIRPPDLELRDGPVLFGREDDWRIGAPQASATISRTRLLKSSTDSVYLLYPGACYERSSGTWSPRTYPIADSLNTYAINTTGPYQQADLSLLDRLWHIVDASTDSAQRPEILDGSRSLWCGKYDRSWLAKVGYPNLTYQILYIDTGAHAAPYTLSMLMNVSAEMGWDYLLLIGGGGGAADPIGNDRLRIDQIIASGSYEGSELLASWTGSITTGGTFNVAVPPVKIEGAPDGEPVTVPVSLTNVGAAHRAIYVVFISDEGWSHEDDRWPHGRGQVLDLIETSDLGVIYDDQPQSLRPDPPFGHYTDSHGGQVLLGTDVAPIVSARVPPGTGEFWRIVSGSTVPTADYCAPQKSLSTNLLLTPADATTSLTVPGTWNEIRTCALPLPPTTARVWVRCNAFLNFNAGAGEGYLMVDLRWYKAGQWSSWDLDRVWYDGEARAWLPNIGNATSQAYGADSIQARYVLQVPGNGLPATYGVLLDDIQFEVETGVPIPRFHGRALPQSTFIDGYMTGTNCSVPPCWPGIDGTETPGGIDDNVNGAGIIAESGKGGDLFGMYLDVGIRPNGMGTNWKYGLGDPATRIVNASFNPAYDAPRMIYRLFDPATLSWSPFDSTVLTPMVSISSGDTLATDAYATDWPPPDKLEANASLPGGFTINGKSSYSQLRYLPRGTRLQYYIKAVDILGNATYVFARADEVEDLPLLPGSTIRAPDIAEFDVLPRVYPLGAPGTLVAGKTGTPVLYLDVSYGGWDSWNGAFVDPVTQALRGLGVRADRYRTASREIGGHPFGDTDQYWLNWPNMAEYGILDLLANQYRIILAPSNSVVAGAFTESDAELLHAWWDASTGGDGGDRCIFASGDNLFAELPKYGGGNVERVAFMNDVFGVGTAIGTWSGGGSNFYPTIDDRFAGGGPGLAAANTFTYPIDGGCPKIRRFDGLTKIASADAQNSAIFPGGAADVAGVARMSEMDPTPDTDRNKALGYSFSIERLRAAGVPQTAPSYPHSGVANRMRVLYKFLTSCRGMRGTGTQCWPCPGTAAEMTSNWAAGTSFQTATYGPLYPIQDFTQATSVEVEEAPRWVNRLEGNFPNPFNPATAIRFSAAATGKVTIRIFDVAGRVVNTLSKNVTGTGTNEVRWNGKAQDGRTLASGVYFYKIRFANGQESQAKMTMLK